MFRCGKAHVNTGGTYYCTREDGHEGPCAAWPVTTITRGTTIEQVKAEAKARWACKVLDLYQSSQPRWCKIETQHSQGAREARLILESFGREGKSFYGVTLDEVRIKAAEFVVAGEPRVYAGIE